MNGGPQLLPDGRAVCDSCDAAIDVAEAERHFALWDSHVCESCADELSEANAQTFGFEWTPGDRALFVDGARATPGVNVDHIDQAAGLRELTACGYHDMHTRMVIDYALARWKRGEEAAAQRGAIDKSFHGIDLTSWFRVLAAACAAGTAKAKAADGAR